MLITNFTFSILNLSRNSDNKKLSKIIYYIVKKEKLTPPPSAPGRSFKLKKFGKNWVDFRLIHWKDKIEKKNAKVKQLLKCEFKLVLF